MQIVQVIIKNFRCIKEAKLHPQTYSVLLGPNNSGKTAILEALNLLLNPEISTRSHSIDENDFHNRIYSVSPVPIVPSNPIVSGTPEENPIVVEGIHDDQVVTQISDPILSLEPLLPPTIYIEAILDDLSDDDEDIFSDFLIPWDPDTKSVVERSDEGEDPFVGKHKAIRVFFEAWYSEEEDDFIYYTKFLREETVSHDDCKDFTRLHKRQIGFLIYRDYRGLTRPITLDTSTLFGRLLQSQNVIPKNFEKVFSDISNVLSPIVTESDFVSLLNAYKTEIELFMPLSNQENSALTFDLTDRTRRAVKENAQLYSKDEIYLPLQKSGAGTRSLSILAMLTLIMRRRQGGILALEEPETFLFPHAQRRVIDECIDLADQIFVTTHSPFVLERIPVEGVGRVQRDGDGKITWQPINTSNVRRINLYSRRLKEVHCEALMGKGVIVVEGDSDRWWLLGASRIINRKEFEGIKQEAFELQGIAVVSADSNGEIIKLAEFFNEAGIKAIGFFDQINDTGLLSNIYSSPIPSVFIWGDGIEEILANELPIEILRVLLTEAPHSTQPLLSVPVVALMGQIDVRRAALQKLIHEKGSASMHDWLISLLDENSLPKTLKRVINIISLYITKNQPLSIQTIMRD